MFLILLQVVTLEICVIANSILPSIPRLPKYPNMVIGSFLPLTNGRIPQ